MAKLKDEQIQAAFEIYLADAQTILAESARNPRSELKAVFDNFVGVRKKMEGRVGAAFTTGGTILLSRLAWRMPRPLLPGPEKDCLRNGSGRLPAAHKKACFIPGATSGPKTPAM